MWFARLRHRFRVLSRYILLRKDIGLRFFFCLLLGIFLLIATRYTKFDSRFRIRPEKPIGQSIVMISVHPSELSQSRNREISRKLLTTESVQDAVYFEPTIWTEFLKNILAQHPKKIGVTFFFTNPYPIPLDELLVFQDPQIVWGAVTTQNGHTFYPAWTNSEASNVGAVDFARDEDGIVRRFVNSSSGVSHLAEKLTQLPQVYASRYINYRAPSQNIPTYAFSDVVENRIPLGSFENKIVIVGPQESALSEYLTPLGPANRAALTAQVVDNILSSRWIRVAPFWVYVVELFIWLAVTSFLVARFPNTVAFVILGFLGLLNSTLAFWIFDQFFIFIPIIAPAAMIFSYWIVTVGYHATRFEKRARELQQERHTFTELDQLKNNFISLISHDLKTPLAKIKGVADRLMANLDNSKHEQDLFHLKASSDELLRYIQSILQMLHVETKNFKLQAEVGDINETLVKTMEQVGPLVKSKRLQIETQLEPLFSIEADFTLLKEVFLNVIENAIKYSPEGSVISIHSFEKDEFVHVLIRDEGMGIPQEEIAKIWGKFYRAQDALTNTTGSGLGLYLVKYFVERHGGSVSVSSQVGKGTQFRISLPFELDKTDELREFKL